MIERWTARSTRARSQAGSIPLPIGGRPMNPRIIRWVLASTMLSSAGSLWGQTGVAGPWTGQLYFENDSRGAGTDEYYTHGTRLEFGRVGWGLGLGSLVYPDVDACTSFSTNQSECYVEALRFTVGQNMYTPRDLTVRDRIIGDRPYGGWLYLGTRTEAATGSQRSGFGLNQGRQWGLGLDIGVVGPSSKADTVQRWWHESVAKEAPRPEGWEHQISDRFGFILQGDLKQRLVDIGSRVEITSERVRYLDVIGETGVAVGNVFTYGRAGGIFRLGYNLGDDFGPNYIAPVVPPVTGSARQRRERPRWEAYTFLAGEQRLVAHNVFIDAEAERHQIEREPWVHDYSWGFVLRYCYLTFNYRRMNRSQEYRPNDVTHHYDAVSLGLASRCR